MNFQRMETDNGSYYYKYVAIGSWDSGNLTMVDDERIYWPSRTAVPESDPLESVCSKPCDKGKVKVWEKEIIHTSIIQSM